MLPIAGQTAGPNGGYYKLKNWFNFFSKFFFSRVCTVPHSLGKSAKPLKSMFLNQFQPFLAQNLYINLACLSVCLFVCLSVCFYPINVKTAEPIGPKFFVGHLGSPGKVYEWSKFQIFVSIKIRSSLNFWKFFVKIREFFFFCFTMYRKRKCSQLI